MALPTGDNASKVLSYGALGSPTGDNASKVLSYVVLSAAVESSKVLTFAVVTGPFGAWQPGPFII